MYINYVVKETAAQWMADHITGLNVVLFRLTFGNTCFAVVSCAKGSR